MEQVQADLGGTTLLDLPQELLCKILIAADEVCTSSCCPCKRRRGSAKLCRDSPRLQLLLACKAIGQAIAGNPWAIADLVSVKAQSEYQRWFVEEEATRRWHERFRYGYGCWEQVDKREQEKQKQAQPDSAPEWQQYALTYLPTWPAARDLDEPRTRALVEALLARGARPLTGSACDPGLTLVCGQGYLSVLRLLLQPGQLVAAGAVKRAVLEAAYYGHLDLVKLLMSFVKPGERSRGGVQEASSLQQLPKENHPEDADKAPWWQGERFARPTCTGWLQVPADLAWPDSCVSVETAASPQAAVEAGQQEAMPVEGGSSNNSSSGGAGGGCSTSGPATFTQAALDFLPKVACAALSGLQPHVAEWALQGMRGVLAAAAKVAENAGLAAAEGAPGGGNGSSTGSEFPQWTKDAHKDMALYMRLVYCSRRGSSKAKEKRFQYQRGRWITEGAAASPEKMLACLRLLVESGMDVNAVLKADECTTPAGMLLCLDWVPYVFEKDGKTGRCSQFWLEAAALSGSARVVEWLMSQGAQAYDRGSACPLFYALLGGHVHLVPLLEPPGAREEGDGQAGSPGAGQAAEADGGPCVQGSKQQEAVEQGRRAPEDQEDGEQLGAEAGAAAWQDTDEADREEEEEEDSIYSTPRGMALMAFLNVCMAAYFESTQAGVRKLVGIAAQLLQHIEQAFPEVAEEAIFDGLQLALGNESEWPETMYGSSSEKNGSHEAPWKASEQDRLLLRKGELGERDDFLVTYAQRDAKEVRRRMRQQGASDVGREYFYNLHPGCEPLARLMVAHGADPNAHDGAILRHAARCNNLRGIEIILSLPGADVNAGQGRALAAAIRHGASKAVDALLTKHGADPTLSLKALAAAAKRGDVDLVRRLIDTAQASGKALSTEAYGRALLAAAGRRAVPSSSYFDSWHATNNSGSVEAGAHERQRQLLHLVVFGSGSPPVLLQQEWGLKALEAAVAADNKTTAAFLLQHANIPLSEELAAKLLMLLAKDADSYLMPSDSHCLEAIRKVLTGPLPPGAIKQALRLMLRSRSNTTDVYIDLLMGRLAEVPPPALS